MAAFNRINSAKRKACHWITGLVIAWINLMPNLTRQASVFTSVRIGLCNRLVAGVENIGGPILGALELALYPSPP